MLPIEQFATIAPALGKRAYVMEGGRLLYSGTAAELREHPELLRSAHLLRGQAAAPPTALSAVPTAEVAVSVAAIDHVLVLSDDMDATRDFYCEVVGLRVGNRPPLEFPGYWLYAESPSACLHVAQRAPYLRHLVLAAGTQTSGEIDHIAFTATDYQSATVRIEASGITPVRNTIPGGPRQLFE